MAGCCLTVKFDNVCLPVICLYRIPAVLPKFNIKFSRVSLDKLALPCYNMGVMRGEKPHKKGRTENGEIRLSGRNGERHSRLH